MAYIGKNPNGLNSLSSSLVSLYVSGSSIVDFETGSVQIYGSISSSLFEGNGAGLFNISAEGIGDINRLKSGSAELVISPNNGLVTNKKNTPKWDNNQSKLNCLSIKWNKLFL